MHVLHPNVAERIAFTFWCGVNEPMHISIEPFDRNPNARIAPDFLSFGNSNPQALDKGNNPRAPPLDHCRRFTG
jgi:hypothetical protein